MKITKDTFMDILGLPEWDDRVIAVLEQLELEKPVVKEGEVYAYLSSKKYGIDLMFDYDCITPEQKEMEGNANLYLRQVSFTKMSSIQLPFNIEMNDDYNTVVKKISKEPDRRSKGSDTSFRWDIEWDNKEIRFVCNFNDNTLSSLKECWMDL